MSLDIFPTWVDPYSWYKPCFSSINKRENKCPKPGKTLVLDIDETMVHTMEDIEDLKEFRNSQYLPLRKRIYDFWIDDPENGKEHVWGITRPHLWEFLSFANDYFGPDNIYVWSSGNKPYVHAICDFIWQDFNLPRDILTADNCWTHKVTGEYGKPLKILYDMHSHLAPESTIIIDDLKKNLKHNKDNGILIPQYKPEAKPRDMNQDDGALLDVVEFFSSPRVKNTNDIRVIDKTRIFK